MDVLYVAAPLLRGVRHHDPPHTSALTIVKTIDERETTAETDVWGQGEIHTRGTHPSRMERQSLLFGDTAGGLRPRAHRHHEESTSPSLATRQE